MEVGNILVSRYGYGVSLVSFYKIVKKTEKMVTLQEMKSKFTEHDGYGQQGLVIPTNEKEDRTIFSRRILYSYDEPYVKINEYERARVWDNQPVWYDSCD